MDMKKTVTVIMAVIAIFTLFATGAYAERGKDGELKLIYWQAPSIINPYLSGGTKDVHASAIVLEPLANYLPSGEMIPTLASEIPKPAADLKSITWKLKPGVVWSDGTPFTAEDVVFTADYCRDPAGGCSQLPFFKDVESVEKVDDLTVKINFGVPKPFPYGPFVGSQAPVLQKNQFKNCMGAKAPTCTDANFGPIGTGAFKVSEFHPNDTVIYVVNEKFRDPNKPAFSKVMLKGGGDAASAARSVLETGEFDFAWNLQVEPEVLTKMEKVGKGKVVAAFGTGVERLMVNLTDPDAKLGDKRGTKAHPHPYLSDIAVRKALSLAIDRQILVDVGYGSAGKATCNVLSGPEIYASSANDDCKTQNIEMANKILDEAGWKRGSNGIRSKNGVRLSILYQTSTNSVRQATQAMVKQMWQQIGVETELKNISGSVFFGGDQASPDTYQKFFADIEMYTNTFNGTDPETYMNNWKCSEAPTPENQWIGNNMPRYCDPEYDALLVKMSKTAVLEERIAIAKKLNDKLMQAYAIIPLIHRGDVDAWKNSIGGYQASPWDSSVADIEDWYRK